MGASMARTAFRHKGLVPSHPVHTQLLTRTMNRQFDGSVNREWHEAGVVMTLTITEGYFVT